MNVPQRAERPRPGDDGRPDHPHKHPRVSLVWKIFSITVGSLLILLGLLMLLTPGPGWLAIFAGLAMLSPYSRWAHQIMTWLKEKVRRIHRRQEPPAGR